MAEVGQLRRLLPRELVDELWRHAHDGHGAAGRRCAGCGRPMAEFPFETGGHALRMDVCPRCRYLWFDPLQYQAMPKLPLPKRPRDLPAEVREALERGHAVAHRQRPLGDELWLATEALWWVAETFVHLPFWAL